MVGLIRHTALPPTDRFCTLEGEHIIWTLGHHTYGREGLSVKSVILSGQVAAISWTERLFLIARCALGWQFELLNALFLQKQLLD